MGFCGGVSMVYFSRDNVVSTFNDRRSHHQIGCTVLAQGTPMANEVWVAIKDSRALLKSNVSGWIQPLLQTTIPPARIYNLGYRPSH